MRLLDTISIVCMPDVSMTRYHFSFIVVALGPRTLCPGLKGAGARARPKGVDQWVNIVTVA